MIQNAVQNPKRYYGLHMVEGVAEYADQLNAAGEPMRLLVRENAIKSMDPSFEGKPLYVQHVNSVDMKKFEDEAAGIVVRSFYNQYDGKHWAEFLVWSEAGIQAVNRHWKLSNAYVPTQVVGGGENHAVRYDQEVKTGEYKHLALVPNPRYEESIILTPDEFKAYNSKKELELKTLANSKGAISMFKFWNKKQLDNSADIEGATVTLSNGVEKSVAQLINDAEAGIKKEKEEKDCKANEAELALKEVKPSVPVIVPVMANGEHKFKVGEEEMSVNELAEKYMSAKKNADEASKKAEEDAKKNAEEKEAKDKEHEAKNNSKANIDAIANANGKSSVQTIEIMSDRVQRGKERY